MASQVSFTVYATPVPQGSMKSFIIKGKWGAKDRSIVTSDNKKLKPFRGQVTETAMAVLSEKGIAQPFAGKHVPVSILADFYLAKPQSVAKKRVHPSVKPDLDKLIRSLCDAMTGVIFSDDAQIVEFNVRKKYGSPERVEVSITILEGGFDVKEQCTSQTLF